MKKTFNVDEYRKMVNLSLAVSTRECSSDMRQGMITMLEEILYRTGNYKGFQYLMQDEVPYGQKPGINCNSTGLIESTEERFARTDSTRVRFI